MNSRVLLIKLVLLISHSSLPHREGGERGQCSAGGNFCSCRLQAVIVSSSQGSVPEVQVISVKDFIQVIMIRFCL